MRNIGVDVRTDKLLNGFDFGRVAQLLIGLASID